jgi:hypothetical protein
MLTNPVSGIYCLQEQSINGAIEICDHLRTRRMEDIRRILHLRDHCVNRA